MAVTSARVAQKKSRRRRRVGVCRYSFGTKRRGTAGGRLHWHATYEAAAARAVGVVVVIEVVPDL